MNCEDPMVNFPLDWTYKGLAPEMEGLLLSELNGLRISLFDDRLLFPVAILGDQALRDNSEWMRRFLSLTGVDIAPHGKTTMAPDLFRIQIEDGAWAISAATVHHVRAYRKFGISRIFLANQMTGSGATQWIINELARDASFDFYSLIDSVEMIEKLVEAVRRAQLNRPLQLLIEVGMEGGRTGVRSAQQGLEIAETIARFPAELSLVGIETFEGVFQMAPDGRERAAGMIDNVVELARACDYRALFCNQIILSAGGSAYFDFAAEKLNNANLSLPTRVVIRSGCYLSHDNGMYQDLVRQLLDRFPDAGALKPSLMPALQVWAQVQSRPEPGLLICAMGKRDVGTDAHVPKLIAWSPAGESLARPAPSGYVVTGLNDQHTFLTCPAESPMQVGDYVGFGISHPCTTFDRWRLIFRVDSEYQITGAVRTYF